LLQWGRSRSRSVDGRDTGERDDEEVGWERVGGGGGGGGGGCDRRVLRKVLESSAVFKRWRLFGEGEYLKWDEQPNVSPEAVADY
jgi:hypothetical protein